MSICLCNLTADVALELAAQNRMSVEPASPNPSFFVSDAVVAREALGELFETLPKPVEVLVGSARKRRNSSELSCHVWRERLPNGSFFSLGDDVYVTSPELTLLLQANQLHQVNLCQMLGRYLGTWSPCESSQIGQVERTPLTTLQSLNEYLRSMESVRGTSNLRLAMEHTCEGAASAPETALQLALCLPPELHGLGIAPPTMNYKVDLSRASQRLYACDSIRIDLCWRQGRFGLEYQGSEHASRLGMDCSRWFAAHAEGYELWLVSKEQLGSAAQMTYIGREVAKRIGHEVNEALWPTESELQDLLDILAGRRRPKPIGIAELRRLRAKTSSLRRAAQKAGSARVQAYGANRVKIPDGAR